MSSLSFFRSGSRLENGGGLYLLIAIMHATFFGLCFSVISQNAKDAALDRSSIAHPFYQKTRQAVLGRRTQRVMWYLDRTKKRTSNLLPIKSINFFPQKVNSCGRIRVCGTLAGSRAQRAVGYSRREDWDRRTAFLFPY